MNILVFNWQDIKNPLGGGAEVHFHEIFKRIAGRGHSVTLYSCTFPESTTEEDIDGIRVIREGSRELFNYYVPRRYVKQFRHERYDIVIDDINKIPFFTPWYVHEPLLGIVHHLFDKSIFVEASFPAASYVYAAERLALRVYRHTPIAVVSKSTQDEMIRNGYRRESLPIVPNCVDHDLYKAPAVKKSNGFTIGYLGRLKKYKSADHLLKAFQTVKKTLPEAQLHIVGDGDVRSELQKLSEELGIASSVTFFGYVEERKKVELLQACDLVVNTSAKEGWGLTVIEANACGVPVIASDVQGLRDSVIHEQTGLLYSYGNITSLSNDIIRLLNDPATRKTFADQSLTWAASFHWDQSADKMLAAMEQTIERKL